MSDSVQKRTLVNLPLPSDSVDGALSTPSFCLVIPLLSKLFPFHLAFNRNLQLVQVGDALQKLCPDLVLGETIEQSFCIRYPDLPLTFTAIHENTHTLLLLETLQEGFQLHGQAIYLDAQDVLVFLGSPWLANAEALKSLGTQISEPLAQDSVTDFLFLLQARAASLSQTRKLAEHLTEQRQELHRALHHAELVTAVLEQAADAIEITDTHLKIIYVNTAFERMTGYTRQEAVGNTAAMLFRAGQQEEAFYEEIWETVKAGEVWDGVFLGRRKDGGFYHQEATIFPVYDHQGKITNYVSIKRDISDRKRTQTRLEHSLSLLHATFEATADGMLVTDIRGKILQFNRKFIDLWEIPESVLMMRDHHNVMNFIESRLKDPKRFSIKKILELYIRPHLERCEELELRDGRTLEWYSCPQRVDDLVIGWVWSFRDITERQRTEEKMRRQAMHDALTGLPNRALFNERLEDALKLAEAAKRQMSVMFLDLDRFKLINDTLGHAAGDRLLQEVANRLKTCVRHTDTVARWAGDEFTLLLPNLRDAEDGLAIAQDILNAMKPELILEGHPVRITTSIGVAIYPNDGEDAETLVKNADAALYRAKESGRNGYHLYTSSLNSEASERLRMEGQLHRALERQEFTLVYQPRVNVLTGVITHMEALVRWQHPEMGLVSPMKFIPLAEETGLIVPLGEWVLRTACAQHRLWRTAGLPAIQMAVNLSARQFKQPQLVQRIGQVLQENGMDPDHLELEITETAVMQNVDLAKRILSDLHRCGVSIALDDFGTGYSSLGYLKEFPFHALKIDKSFVRDIPTDPNDRAIVAAIIAMGKVLNLRLVAEGVETEVQEYLLRSLDCEEMQGYRFSCAVPAEAATELLKHGIPCLTALRLTA